jgi:hypothetical protein
MKTLISKPCDVGRRKSTVTAVRDRHWKRELADYITYAIPTGSRTSDYTTHTSAYSRSDDEPRPGTHEHIRFSRLRTG